MKTNHLPESISKKRIVIAGFTLIELLVVIAIIAVLASMLLPALNQSREKARQTKCVGILKQYGTALSMYFSTYDDFGVPWGGDSYHWFKNPGFRALLDGAKPDPASPGNLMYSNRITPGLICPNATFAFQVKNNEGCEIPFSYGLNHDPFYQYNQIAPKVTRVKRPSKVPEFADTLGWLFRKCYAENLLAWQTVTTPSVWGNIFAYRHGNRAALCMLDGHVEVLPPTEVIHELVWAEIYE